VKREQGGRVPVGPTDEELLVSADPADFGLFYARHLGAIERYFARKVGRDEAADLASETFAAALVARRRFVPGPTPAVGWLYTIAARRLVDNRRRGHVQQRALEALTSEVGAPDPAATWTAVADELDTGLLRHLPRDQRDAIVAHVIQERDYRQIAARSRASEASVRQRVSRGLSELRRPLQLYRASQQLAHEGRTYRFGGGHGRDLHCLEPREPLDCSSSASLILLRANLFQPGPAWNSRRLAENWGHPGEGRYVTVWANEEHVWIEFKLDADHGERFDPTPSRLAPNTSWIRNTSGPRHEFLPRHWPGL
jgi:RNA polymerase sigma-70 factor (ECF subfamily)